MLQSFVRKWSRCRCKVTSFSSVDALATLSQFEAERKCAFVEAQPKEKKACEFFTCFAFCLLLIITFLLQIFADPTVFVLYYSICYLVLPVTMPPILPV